jgi:serine/threonine-protein kinase HipA
MRLDNASQKFAFRSVRIRDGLDATVSESREEVVAHLDDADLGKEVVGRLRRLRRAANSVLSFEFDPSWLRRGHRFVLDPGLLPHEGEQYSGDLFGIFGDTAPDRWGRTLLQRREAATARRDGRRPRILTDWDFLVGVSDELRMGSLRLADPSDGHYVSSELIGVPPMARLRQLQYYAQRAERGERLPPMEEEQEIALLVASGSSLGGARPKANFRAEDGNLWIAKFPSRNDGWDVGGWEYVLNQLANAAKISVPETGLLELSEGHRTFTAKRFDRVNAGRRLYASAMTLIGKRDLEPASYLDIAEAITRFGDPTAINEDLDQLFRRVVFNVITAHRDDHLRNHGFLANKAGWRISPAFDLNPIPTNPEHALSVDEQDHAPSLDVARATAEYYRLKSPRVEEIIREVNGAVEPWRSVASTAAIDRDEIEIMAEAFRLT